MSTTEDFENAPIGATATRGGGLRAMKLGGVVQRRWIFQNGFYMTNKEMENWGYTLDPLSSQPTSAQEALELAWELAYPVKEGQIVPEDTDYISKTATALMCRASIDSFTVSTWDEGKFRTLEPLPDPEPDWLDAPAVFAHCGYCSHEDYGPQMTLHGSVLEGQKWDCAECQTTTDWSALSHVTPLYPKED